MKTLIATSLLALLCACSNLSDRAYPMEVVPSANASERVRFLVMHYTAIDFDRSLRALTLPSSNPVSSHYLIPERDDPSYPHDELKVFQLVDEHRRAWHAGPGKWEDREQVNDQSIGIEIVNRAHCHPPMEQTKTGICFFPEFDREQIELVIQLSKDILARNPDITPTRVVGHGDILPQYKNDPGPRFPWQQLAAAGIGAWYEDSAVIRYFDQLSAATEADPAESEREFVGLLAAYGYGIDPEEYTQEDVSLYVSAFQYHFRAWKVDGEIDHHSHAILLALIEKYFPDNLPESYRTGTMPETDS